jgi:uncharacterized protein YkwD
MTDIVKQVIEEHNLIRTNPQSYIPFLEKEMSYFQGTTLYKPGEIPLCTNEGKRAYQDCINFLKKQKPLPSLEHNTKLSKAAQDHASDIGSNGIFSHTGSDGSESSERIERYLQWDISCAENISFGCKTGRDIVMQLILDDGQLERGHRRNIFSNNSTMIGVGFAKHSEQEFCCVIDYIGGVAGKSNGNTGFKGFDNGWDDSKNRGKSVFVNDNSKLDKKQVNVVNPRMSEFSNFSNQMLYREGFDNFGGFGKSNFGNFVDDQNDDPDRPEDAVSCSVKTSTKTVNGKTKRKSVKTYRLSTGGEYVVEIDEDF